MRNLSTLPLLFTVLAFGPGCPVWDVTDSSGNPGAVAADPDRTGTAPDSDPDSGSTEGTTDPETDPGASTCRIHGDCAVGNYCGDNASCVASGTCEADSECAGEFVCDFRGTCVPLAPGACLDEAHCPDGKNCVEGTCRAEGDLCQFNYQCGVNRGCVDNACVAICATSETCGSGASCQDGFCQANPSECLTSEACGTGENCVEGRCLPDCLASETCSAATDVCADDGFCRPDWTTRIDCDANTPCFAPHVCQDGYCRTPCEGGTNSECQAVDAQFVVCAEDLYCYSSNETSPECFAPGDCTDTNDACIDAICR